MAYYSSHRSPSFFDNFSLYPLPYPVLFILLVITLLLSLQFYSSYESVVESAEEGLGWVLLVVPVALLFVVRWLSSCEGSGGGWIFGSSPFDRQRRQSYWPSGEGGSPWGVAAVIVLLLVLVQYQSGFHEGWFLFD